MRKYRARKLVQSPKFAESIKGKIGGHIDSGELEQELERLRKRLRQLNGTKDRLGQQIDALNYDDPHYERKLQDLQERQNKIYDDIASAEADIAEAQMRLNYIPLEKLLPVSRFTVSA